MWSRDLPALAASHIRVMFPFKAAFMECGSWVITGLEKLTKCTIIKLKSLHKANQLEVDTNNISVHLDGVEATVSQQEFQGSRMLLAPQSCSFAAIPITTPIDSHKASSSNPCYLNVIPEIIFCIE